LAPTGSPQTKLDESSALGKKIAEDFGSLENLKKTVNTTTAGVQGSGWGWLGYNTKTKKLEAVTTANQDPLLSTFLCMPELTSSPRSHPWH
jgi:Fe-Mn family superoxide dismutase